MISVIFLSFSPFQPLSYSKLASKQHIYFTFLLKAKLKLLNLSKLFIIMLKAIVRLVLVGFLVSLVPRILDGVYVDGIETGVIVAFIMTLLNIFVKPILKVLSFPINILTLGLFSLLINVFLVYITAYLVTGFHVDSFLPALIFSILLSITTAIVDGLIK